MNFGKDIVQRFGDLPAWMMSSHFREITDIRDMVTLAISIDVVPEPRPSFCQTLFSELERFKNRATVATNLRRDCKPRRCVALL
jgi:hypothetical protein